MASSKGMQYLVETDILADFLTTSDVNGSLLKQALRSGSCYTTMLNALELFRAAGTTKQEEGILQMLHLVRVLGYNARYAQPFAQLAREIERKSGNRPLDENPIVVTPREVMMIGMANASKLTLLTISNYHRYQQLGCQQHGVAVLNAVPEFTQLSSITSTEPPNDPTAASATASASATNAARGSTSVSFIQ